MKSLIFGVNKINYPAKEDGTVIDLGTVAIWNEYGTKNAPPRPAFRMGLEQAMNTRKPNIEAFLKSLTSRALNGIDIRPDLNTKLEKLLTGIGQSAVKETKEIIKLGTTTKNSPVTIAKKGFNHPLYHTGVLLANVNYEVIDE